MSRWLFVQVCRLLGRRGHGAVRVLPVRDVELLVQAMERGDTREAERLAGVLAIALDELADLVETGGPDAAA